ncbi:hypothetical protein BD309DRAFT_968189 [Dichomitus squalens]|nr:hypothetical protein BD309DRAFT_968189 [Dichomitus squalens]
MPIRPLHSPLLSPYLLLPRRRPPRNRPRGKPIELGRSLTASPRGERDGPGHGRLVLPAVRCREARIQRGRGRSRARGRRREGGRGGYGTGRGNGNGRLGVRGRGRRRGRRRRAFAEELFHPAGGRSRRTKRPVVRRMKLSPGVVFSFLGRSEGYNDRLLISELKL